MILNERLEQLRHNNNLTQQNVADILGVQREVYRRYEKGTRELPISCAVILADYYQVSLDYMVGAVDIPTRPKELIELKIENYPRTSKR